MWDFCELHKIEFEFFLGCPMCKDEKLYDYQQRIDKLIKLIDSVLGD